MEVIKIRGKLHLFYNSIILIIIGLLSYYYIIHSILILIGVYSGIIFGNVSDLDLTIGEKYHRHFLFHSIIWTLILWLISWGFLELQLIISFWILAIGLHCFEDIRLNRFSTRGYYTIKIRQTISGKIKGLSGFQSTIWLILNFIGGNIIFLLTLYLQ